MVDALEQPCMCKVILSLNSDLIGAEHLMMSDENASTRFADRLRMGAAIKRITAEQWQDCHSKRQDKLTLSPFWLLTISLNDNPERLMILPPMMDDIKDKLSLFKVLRYDMPMHTITAQDYRDFWNAIILDVPHYIYWLENSYQILDEFGDERWGIKAWQHPDICLAINELTPCYLLEEILKRSMIWKGKLTTGNIWIGSAIDLEIALNREYETGMMMAKLCRNSISLGKLLHELSSGNPEGCYKKHTNAGNVWHICKDKLCTKKEIVK